MGNEECRTKACFWKDDDSRRSEEGTRHVAVAQGGVHEAVNSVHSSQSLHPYSYLYGYTRKAGLPEYSEAGSTELCDQSDVGTKREVWEPQGL